MTDKQALAICEQLGMDDVTEANPWHGVHCEKKYDRTANLVVWRSHGSAAARVQVEYPEESSKTILAFVTEMEDLERTVSAVLVMLNFLENRSCFSL